MSFRDPRDVLKAHGLWTKKQFGQNFLIQAQIPERIAMVGGARSEDTVFEIGAGCGTLTRSLAPRCGRLIALEYDRDLVGVARSELAWADHVEVRSGNVLDVDWNEVAADAGTPIIIYGNLPYHLSSKIILSVLAQPNAWTRACFMVQKEFADRLAAPVGTRASSALSAQAALWAVTSHAFDVPPQAFHPAPKVESSVIVMERRDAPPVDVGSNRSFRIIVRALFAQRRKMARKALKPVCDDVASLLSDAELDGTRRGETFTLEEIAALSRALSQRNPSASSEP